MNWYDTYISNIQSVHEEVMKYKDWYAKPENEVHTKGVKGRMALAVGHLFAVGELVGQLEVANSYFGQTYPSKYLDWLYEVIRPQDKEKTWWQIFNPMIKKEIIDIWKNQPRGVAK